MACAGYLVSQYDFHFGDNFVFVDYPCQRQISREAIQKKIVWLEFRLEKRVGNSFSFWDMSKLPNFELFLSLYQGGAISQKSCSQHGLQEVLAGLVLWDTAVCPTDKNLTPSISFDKPCFVKT